MASVPGYSAAGRTRSSETLMSSARSETTSSDQTGDSSPESIEDTETVFLNKPVSSSDDVSNTHTPNKSPSRAVTPVDSSNFEPRKCWICYTDETEESPLNAEWRSPCPCALTAHEACLLDWLADLENPRSRKRNGSPAKMVCPQCKTEIVVSRPKSMIVDVVRLFERLAGRLVLPGMVFTLAGTVWAGCCAHGVYSMYFVFGTEDARQILEESVDGPWNSGINIGLPLIPLALIFSRTRYAEGLLPAIPVLFFATHNPGQETDLDLWPPSAAMTFAALPYVKSFYTAIYDRLFGNLERKWIAEVQPRAADINEFDDNAPQEQDRAAGEAGNGQVLMEIDLELQVGMGHDDEPHGALGMQAGQNNAAGGGAGAQDGQNQGAGQNLGLGRRDDLINETSNLADVVLGALIFPAVSASMGGLLKYVLPKSWTTPSSVLDRARPGLLQTRWGRSVVGGCVFVLLKDALVLYCRWKLAQTHRKRKVLNYDRTKKQVGRR
ncbi:hypothetical protein ASPWEDRAFT_36892 [Aspergillus wentii DTO 134E9]|uniref:RING-CH-type domain-containing protein n=1 Tax=Aspergillus wentii DTO 134E9 TaxID=1073089 RepID=A0A1L9RW65_ASPWE|nr:uncharacterized protein ASPWEDRAFT_36892 [Aspergillus wentii DTO 134E9]KAI9929138.1 hypothetical protein MW887_001542 [Aspergillus wentii]OJJ39165.1 hypothetical protein ASPWEDRAFT_36892 [Aspergillus wentii DTO 134E9]